MLLDEAAVKQNYVMFNFISCQIEVM